MNNVLFACLFLCILGNTTQEDVFGLSGGEIELYPGSSAASITRILWRYQGHKLAEWETDDAGPEYYGIYKARTSLDTKTGILKINNLTKSDNALYSVEINGQPTPKKYNLDVINALDKPAVTCQVNNDSTVTLLCAADQSLMIQYSWEGPDTQGHSGYELQIGGEESQNSDSVYTCVVKNPVSENRQGFSVKSCFPAQVNYPAVIVAAVGVPVVLGVVLVCFFCHNQNQRGRLLRLLSRQQKATAETEESQPLDAAPPAEHAANSSQQTTEGEALKANDSSVETSQQLLAEKPSVTETGDHEMIIGENGTGETAPVIFSKDASGHEEPSKPSDSSAAQDSTG